MAFGGQMSNTNTCKNFRRHFKDWKGLTLQPGDQTYCNWRVTVGVSAQGYCEPKEPGKLFCGAERRFWPDA